MYISEDMQIFTWIYNKAKLEAKINYLGDMMGQGGPELEAQLVAKTWQQKNQIENMLANIDTGQIGAPVHSVQKGNKQTYNTTLPKSVDFQSGPSRAVGANALKLQ